MSNEEARKLLVENVDQEVLPIPSETVIPQFMRAAVTEEAVRLSVSTTNKYLDFKENLDEYFTNKVERIQFPFRGKLVTH
jgi:hypothetical protein